MATYLVHRKGMPEIAEGDPFMLARTVFFQMWQKRASPYTALADGDLVFIADPVSRRVWAARVDKLLTDFPYHGHAHALRALRKAYGLYPEDLNDHHGDRSETGWLLAWAPKVLAQLDQALPEGIPFGHNGYRALSDSEAALILGRGSLPDTAIASPPSWYDPSRAKRRRAPEVSRYVPKHVVEQVKQRDRNRCSVCGTKQDLHLDHIRPHARGGPSTVENLRLLCAYSNLSKGVAHPDSTVRCEIWKRLVARAGEEFGLEDGRLFTYQVEGEAVLLLPGSVPVSREDVLAASRGVGPAEDVLRLDREASRRLSIILADPRIALTPETRDRWKGRARRSRVFRWSELGLRGRAWWLSPARR